MNYNDGTGQMLGGGSAVIHYTPAVISSTTSGAVVLMEPSAILTGGGVVEVETEHGEADPNSHHQQQHSPLHLPSTAFLNTHISK